MYATPPVSNLLVIRSSDVERAATFYRELGMVLWHVQDEGPNHYASNILGFYFKICPQRNSDDTTTNTQFGFNVDCVDGIVDFLREINATIVTEPMDTEEGRRAVVKDFDGHTVELITPMNRQSMVIENYRGAQRTGRVKYDP